MLAIIQARMSSKRLTGKVLKLLGKKTLLEWVIDNTYKSKHIKKIIIATSLNHDDDRILKFCVKKKRGGNPPRLNYRLRISYSVPPPSSPSPM